MEKRRTFFTPQTYNKAYFYVTDDVQEEIECLYEFVPEVGEHFEIVDKIGEGNNIDSTEIFLPV